MDGFMTTVGIITFFTDVCAIFDYFLRLCVTALFIYWIISNLNGEVPFSTDKKRTVE